MTSRLTVRIGAALVAAMLASPSSIAAAEQKAFLTAAERAADFAAFCRFVADEYAYFDTKATDWTQSCKHFAERARVARDRTAYVHVLERALSQLYDAHAHLGTNTPTSPRLVPTQSDVAALWRDGKAIVTDVRAGSAAERAGVKAGDEIVAINGQSAALATDTYAPRFLARPDPAARDWALQAALAGRHDQASMKLKLLSALGQRTVSYAPIFPRRTELLTTVVTDRVAHVRFHNSLGESKLVAAFDQALDAAGDARALIVDLRDTPSGGNSSVARGIMGRLVAEPKPYQRHELVEEYRSSGVRRVWVEYVTPRGATFGGPVVVLVGRWTGSMGEGLAIGLNAARGAPVLGRPMAHLLGALGETTLPRSHIVVRVPVEKLFHVDGTPREGFIPCAVPAQGASLGASDEDVELRAAVELAGKLVQSNGTIDGCR